MVTHEDINNYMEQILIKYSQGSHYPTILKAQEIYSQLTGRLSFDNQDDEQRVYSFNEWYLFDFVNDKKSVIDHISNDKDINQELLVYFSK